MEQEDKAIALINKFDELLNDLLSSSYQQLYNHIRVTHYNKDTGINYKEFYADIKYFFSNVLAFGTDYKMKVYKELVKLSIVSARYEYYEEELNKKFNEYQKCVLEYKDKILNVFDEDYLKNFKEKNKDKFNFSNMKIVDIAYQFAMRDKTRMSKEGLDEFYKNIELINAIKAVED